MQRQLAAPVHWLTGYQATHYSQIRSANLASVRLRAGALAAALPESAPALTFGERIPEAAALTVVGKLGANDADRRGANWLIEMQSVKKRGGLLLLDYTDDHLAVSSAMTPFYRGAIELIDMAVCSSRMLAQNLSAFYGGRIEVIPDAIEIATTPAKEKVHDPVTVLWFGHASNLKYLIDFLPLLASEQRLRLLIVCNIEGLRMLQDQSLPIPPNIQAMGMVWSVPEMLAAASESDLCIIPSDPSDIRKAGVSSNRLLTALAMGLPTAADRLDSYLAFDDYFVDIRSTDFQVLLRNPLGFSDRVFAAQQGPVSEHSLEQTGVKWILAINKLLATQ